MNFTWICHLSLLFHSCLKLKKAASSVELSPLRTLIIALVIVFKWHCSSTIIQKPIENSLRLARTMLQKLSKCEVKAWLCWKWIILPPLWFYVKSNFGEFKRSKNVDLTILEVLNYDFSKFEQLSSPKFTKPKNSEPLKFSKLTFLDRLNSPKFDII